MRGILIIVGIALIIEAAVMSYFLYEEATLKDQKNTTKIVLYSVGIFLALVFAIIILLNAKGCTKFKFRS